MLSRLLGDGDLRWLTGSDEEPEFVTFVTPGSGGGFDLGIQPQISTQTVRLIPAAEFDYDADGDSVPPIIEQYDDLLEYIESDDLALPPPPDEWRTEYATLGVDWGDGAASPPLPPAFGPPGPVPPVVDHRPSQTAIKNQGDRGTCVSHATCALLETLGQRPADLSEQMTHHQFMVHLGIPHSSNSGITTTDAPTILTLANRYTCLEHEWPYVDQFSSIQQKVAAGPYGPPSKAVQAYGVATHTVIGDSGGTGASIKNCRYLETLLAAGYDIVIGSWASWSPSPIPGVIQPLLANGQPAAKGGHAMLVVGYNQPGQYFIVKNSWGDDWEHAGYGYFSYDFVRACFKYGYIVTATVP